jgi:hypothetical protein
MCARKLSQLRKEPHEHIKNISGYYSLKNRRNGFITTSQAEKPHGLREARWSMQRNFS